MSLHPRLLVGLAALSASAVVSSWEPSASACSCAIGRASVLFPSLTEVGRPIGVETRILLGNYDQESFTLIPVDQFVDDSSAVPNPGTDVPVPVGTAESGQDELQDAGAPADASAAEPIETGDSTQAASVVYRRTAPVDGSWGFCGPSPTAFYAPEAPLQPGTSYAVRLDANTLETFVASEEAAPLATADDVQFFVFSEHWAGTNYNLDVFVQTTPGTSVLVTAVGDHAKMVQLADGPPTRGLALGNGECADLVAYALDGSVIVSERRCDYDASYDRSGQSSFVSTDCDVNAAGRTWEFWQAVMEGEPTPSPGIAGTESADDSPAPDDFPAAGEPSASEGDPTSDDPAPTAAGESAEVELQAVPQTSDDASSCALQPLAPSEHRGAAGWYALATLLALSRVRRRSGRSSLRS